MRSGRDEVRLLKVPKFVSDRLGANEEVETRTTSCQVANWDVLSSRTEAGASGMAGATTAHCLAARYLGT